MDTPGCQCPRNHEAESAEGRNHAQPAQPTNAQQVKTARENRDAGQHQAASPGQAARTRVALGQQTDKPQPERMPHVIVNRRAINGHVGFIKLIFQPMRAKCAEGHGGQGGERRRDVKSCAFHEIEWCDRTHPNCTMTRRCLRPIGLEAGLIGSGKTRSGLAAKLWIALADRWPQPVLTGCHGHRMNMHFNKFRTGVTL